jgi:hypothetical protein
MMLIYVHAVTTECPMITSIAPAKAMVALVEQTDQVNPSPLALFGLAYLALSPFSIAYGNIRIGAAALLVAAYVALRPKLLGAQSDQSLQILDRSRLGKIYLWFGLLFFHAIVCIAISTAILLPRGEAEGMEILDRGGKQLGTLFLSLIQLASGYHLAKYIKVKTIRATILATFWITLVVCGYQIVAEGLGLPYIGTYAVDSNFGLRISGLSGEPKGLSVYLLSVIPLLLTSGTGGRSSRLVPHLPGFIGVGLAVYFFFLTASGNGFLSVGTMIAMYFLAFTTPRKALLGIGLLLALLIIAPGFELSGFTLRESHRNILENIQNLDLGLFDDLIALPLIAWKEYPLSLLIGFGPGFLHFFSRQYVDQGTWVHPDVFIDGGIGAIKYLSDFGLILGSGLFVYVFLKARRMIGAVGANELRPLKVYFLSVFVLGALTGGNSAIPLFLAAGWILGTSKV